MTKETPFQELSELTSVCSQIFRSSGAPITNLLLPMLALLSDQQIVKDLESILKRPNQEIGPAFLSYLSNLETPYKDIIYNLNVSSLSKKVEEAKQTEFFLFKLLNYRDTFNQLDNIQKNDVIDWIIKNGTNRHSTYTTPNVRRFMLSLLFPEPPAEKSILFDPTCGTGGFLADAANHFSVQTTEGHEISHEFGELAKCRLLILGIQSDIHIKDTLNKPQKQKFDYVVTHPLLGGRIDRDALQSFEDETGPGQRFEGGIANTLSYDFLFLQHALYSLNEAGRMTAITTPGALFRSTTSESQTRGWLLEKDYIETIVQLGPSSLDGISMPPVIWLLNKNKPKNRKHRVQLIDASAWNRRMPDGFLKDLVKTYSDFQENDICRIVPSEAFYYQRITLERPLRYTFKNSKKAMTEFLDSAPALIDGYLAFQEALPNLNAKDWNQITKTMIACCKTAGTPMQDNHKELFEKVFAEVSTDAEPVRNKHGLLPNISLRDYLEIPYNQNPRDFIEKNVHPVHPDAFLGNVDIGNRIQFQNFFQETVSQNPHEDYSKTKAALKESQEKIINLLTEMVG